jgi:hypothetical protein
MDDKTITILLMGLIVVGLGLFASFMDSRRQDAAARVRADDVT